MNGKLMTSIFKSRLVKKALLATASLAITLVSPSNAAAQGCAMCYQSASAAKKSGLEALQNGVLILLIPPLLMFAAILWQMFRRRSAQGAAVWDPGAEGSVPPECRDLDSAPRIWPHGIFTETRKSNNMERTQS